MYQKAEKTLNSGPDPVDREYEPLGLPQTGGGQECVCLALILLTCKTTNHTRKAQQPHGRI